MYAYCNNNPVMNADPTGHFLVSLLASALVGAVISALSYTASEVISFAITGEWTWSWGGFFGSVIGGAIGGAFSTISNTLSVVITSVASTALGMSFQNFSGEANHSFKDILNATLFSGITALIASDATNLISKVVFPVKAGYGNPLFSKTALMQGQNLTVVKSINKVLQYIKDGFFDGLLETMQSGFSDAYGN